MIKLRHRYPKIINGTRLSYGGNQMWSENSVIQKSGCGIVAAADLLWYLEHAHEERPLGVLQDNAPIPLAVYNQLLLHLNRKYFPLIPYAGLNGLILAWGLNRLLHEKRLPYRAKWMLSGQQLWQRVESMLLRDLPVVLSVGPNFPAVWQNKRLRFYVLRPNGSFQPAAATKAHYVTVTGMDEEWIRISSWGQMYFINRQEYMEYVKSSSNFLISNILYLDEK